VSIAKSVNVRALHETKFYSKTLKSRHPDESRDSAKRNAFVNVPSIAAILAKKSLDPDLRRDDKE
jgi:hypothetical protein